MRTNLIRLEIYGDDYGGSLEYKHFSSAMCGYTQSWNRWACEEVVLVECSISKNSVSIYCRGVSSTLTHDT